MSSTFNLISFFNNLSFSNRSLITDSALSIGVLVKSDTTSCDENISLSLITRGAMSDDFSGRIFEIIMFCCVVAIYDLVHAVEAMYSLP